MCPLASMPRIVHVRWGSVDSPWSSFDQKSSLVCVGKWSPGAYAAISVTSSLSLVDILTIRALPLIHSTTILGLSGDHCFCNAIAIPACASDPFLPSAGGLWKQCQSLVCVYPSPFHLVPCSKIAWHPYVRAVANIVWYLSFCNPNNRDPAEPRLWQLKLTIYS